jgi:hypothetical protein
VNSSFETQPTEGLIWENMRRFLLAVNNQPDTFNLELWLLCS